MKYPDVGAQIEHVAADYQYHQTPDLLVKIQDGVANLLRWLADLLRSLRIEVPGLADTRAVGNVMQLLLVGAGVIGATVLIFLVWMRLGQLRGQSIRARRSGSASQVLLDARGWRSEAERLALAEDWRSACRALYLYLLRLLHEQEITPFAPTRTNYEYLYALSGHPSLQKIFRRLVDTVEILWFGESTASKEDYEICRALIAEADVEVIKLKPSALTPQELANA